MPYATLPDRGLIALSGEETLSFLQGLVTNDVLRLHESGIVYAAMLTPQGKFLHDFFIVPHGELVLVDCNKARLPELLKRLAMYRLRAKVKIEAMPDAFGVTAVWDESPPVEKTGTAFRDPRVPGLGWRMYGDSHPHGMSSSADDYDLHRIRLGVPIGDSDLIPEKSFILHFGFEDLHGVDFTKGCYVGQEVTARTKHLGQVRKFIYKVASHENALPATGTPVYHGDILAGELRSSREQIGLALLSVEEVEKPPNSGKSFFCGDRLINVALPDWVKNTPGTKA